MDDQSRRLQHAAIWTAIDELAMHMGWSVSGLAKRCGFDATTLNLSKRIGAGGRRRWPSTEIVAAVLDVTDTSHQEFGAMVDYVRTTLSIRPASVPRESERH